MKTQWTCKRNDLHYMNLYGFTKSKKIRNYSVQELRVNGNLEVKVDTIIKTDVHIKNSWPQNFI